MLYRMLLLALTTLLFACGDSATNHEADNTDVAATPELTLYTHRHYDTDKAIFAKFETESGIKVNVVNANADELIQKMESEGDQSPADLLITVDAGRLVRAKDKGLLHAVNSEVLTNTLPAHLRDADNHWFGLTKRARIVVYDKNKVDPSELSTYEALTDPKWQGKLLIRASSNIYNQSLLASVIANTDQATA